MAKNKKINTDAWAILNDDEKTAISLSLGHSKSTWESGEIMKKAHFKYLEIQKRARKFIEIFTNHFEKYNGLFPENLNLSFPFKEYLILTMIERKNISSSAKQMEDPSYRVASKRSELLINEIERLRKDSSQEAIDLYSLIMDFDRWNNFRILPPQVQEPSAFKRRNKARNVKHMRKATSLPLFSILKIMSKYTYNGKYEKVYLPLVSSHFEEDYKIIPIKVKPSHINELTEAGLFLFENILDAREFAELVADYFLNGVKNCKTGQRFWPQFRVIITKAFNHRQLENIHKTRTYLDSAIFNTDYRKVKAKKSKEMPGEKRVEDDNFFYTK